MVVLGVVHRPTVRRGNNLLGDTIAVRRNEFLAVDALIVSGSLTVLYRVHHSSPVKKIHSYATIGIKL